MSIPTTIAEEFPLLAAIADELGPGEHSEVDRLRTASRLLREAIRSFDRSGRADPDPFTRGMYLRPRGVPRIRHDQTRQLA